MTEKQKNPTTLMQATWEVKKIIKNKDKEKREPSCTVGGNVNWYSHYGEQYGGSLKN